VDPTAAAGPMQPLVSSEGEERFSRVPMPLGGLGTDLAKLAQVGPPWLAAVVASGTRARGRARAGAPLKLTLVGFVERLAWAKDNGCPWVGIVCWRPMIWRAISARPYTKKRKRKKEKTGDVPALGNGGVGDAVPAARVKKLAAGVRIVDEDVDDWKYAREREVGPGHRGVMGMS